MFSGTPEAKSGQEEVLRPQGTIQRQMLGLTSSDPGSATHTDPAVNESPQILFYEASEARPHSSCSACISPHSHKSKVSKKARLSSLKY